MVWQCLKLWIPASPRLPAICPRAGGSAPLLAARGNADVPVTDPLDRGRPRIRTQRLRMILGIQTPSARKLSWAARLSQITATGIVRRRQRIDQRGSRPQAILCQTFVFRNLPWWRAWRFGEGVSMWAGRSGRMSRAPQRYGIPGSSRLRRHSVLLCGGPSECEEREKSAMHNAPTYSSVPEAVGNTPLIRLRRASDATECEILGKAEFLNPRPVRQGSGRALHHPRCRRARNLEARGDNCRGNRREYRDWACPCWRCHGIQVGNRDPGDAEPGEEGHASPCRRGPRRSSRSSLPGSEQLRSLFRASGECPRGHATWRSGLGEPVRQCGQPAGACRDHGAGNLVPDRWPHRRLCVCGWYRRHAGRNRHRTPGAESKRPDCPGRSRGRCTGMPTTRPGS